MGVRFNPPPGWPQPPEGWRPTPTWVPDPSWPAPPAGWEFWVGVSPEPFESITSTVNGTSAATATALATAPARIATATTTTTVLPQTMVEALAADPAFPTVAGGPSVTGAPVVTRPEPEDLPYPHEAPRPRWLVGAGAAAVLGAGILLVTFVMRDQQQTAPVGSSSATLPSVRVVSTPSASPSPQLTSVNEPATSSAASGTALEALENLPLRTSGPATAYSRAGFGEGWTDVDGNGCDTGNDVLRRDLTAVTLKRGSRSCIVASGRLLDKYAARTAVFRPETRSVAIDFVVPLADAWAGGASTWTAEQRTAFVNDPANLSAVQTATTAKKRSRDASGWLPSSVAYRCLYAARQIGVKTTYQLSVSAAERSTLRKVLAGCPDQPLPAGARSLPTSRSASVQPSVEQPAADQPAAEPSNRPLVGSAPSSTAASTG